MHTNLTQSPILNVNYYTYFSLNLFTYAVVAVRVRERRERKKWAENRRREESTPEKVQYEEVSDI